MALRPRLTPGLPLSVWTMSRNWHSQYCCGQYHHLTEGTDDLILPISANSFCDLIARLNSTFTLSME